MATNNEDIIDFIQPLLKGGIFQKSGDIEQIKILQLKDNKTNTFESYGLVTIEPDAVAKRVIKKLNRKAILGKHIAIREYHHRSWHNDQRIDAQVLGKGLKNKRLENRRQSKLQ